MERKEWFREHLIDWVKRRRKAAFDALSLAERSKEMTRYYVQEVVSKLTPGLIPDDFEDIDDYVVDGPHDGGVDFIFRSEGYVLVIQSKYHGSEKREDIKELIHFCEVLQRLYDASGGRSTLNRKVMEVISDIDWDADHFDLRFCSLGKTSDPINDRAKQGATPVKALKDLADRCDLTFLDETELNGALREAISADKEPDTKISVHFSVNEEDQPWIRFESEEGRDLYVGQVSGAELSEIYRPNKYKLFAMNIRDYVGDTATNKGIRQTAINKPDEFVFFNNGISAIATQIEPDGTDPATLHCDRFSIINGAQTVRSIVKAHRQDPASVRQVRILLRIMRYRYNKDGEFLSDVTRFNNTQNSIKISDFRSNDPVQKDFRTRFGRVSVGAKTCEYKNKRKREADSNKFSINMEEFAKTIHSFVWGPDDMFGGTKYLFDVSPKGGYQKVFGEPVSHVTEEEFEKLAGIYFLCSEIYSIWRTRRETEKEEQASPALERRWIVYFAFGELVRMIYARKGGDLDEDLRFLSNPNKWMIVPEHATRKRIAELLDMAATALEQAYGRASVAPDFKHRNWFRSPATLADIRGELKVIPKYRPVADLPKLRQS